MSLSKKPLRVVSWNVNGLRAVAKRGFLDWLEGSGAAIVGIQEVRARPEQLPPEVARPPGWHVEFAAAERPGYSGVGLLGREPPDELELSLGEPRFDVEGRLQLARFGRLWIANVYFPNGNGKNRDLSRIPDKLDFYRALYSRVEALRQAGEPVLVMGDFNTAHQEIDLARPRENVETSGFRPEERAELDRWIRSGWVDTFRRFETGSGHYSWWSQRQGVREKNVGWRLDMVLASEAALVHVEGAAIHAHVLGSDHCPVSVDLDPRVLG